MGFSYFSRTLSSRGHVLHPPHLGTWHLGYGGEMSPSGFAVKRGVVGGAPPSAALGVVFFSLRRA